MSRSRRRKIRQDIERAARSRDPQGSIEALLRGLGQVGNVIRTIARLFGGRHSRLRELRNSMQESDFLEAVRQLEETGWEIDSRGNVLAPEQPPGPWDNKRLGGRRSRSTDDGPEISIDTRVRNPGDPFDSRWKGLSAWHMTPQSSNVYAFAYDYETGILYVRYKQDVRGQGKVNLPGPMYSYGGHRNQVPPRIFEAMIRASSKGKFVWDYLRVRGTIHGHRYPYTLVTPGSDDYVPRKATRKGLRTRQVSIVSGPRDNRKKRRFRSSLPPKFFGKPGRETPY